MGSKTLSVLMTNYNHGKYIKEALEAILSQSFKPLEVLVVDDASVDNSVEIIKEIAAKNPNLRLIRNEENKGAVANYNKLLHEAKGDYIVGAASDDKMLPGFFEKSMALLEKYPQAGLCCSNPVFFRDNGELIKEEKINISAQPDYIPAGKVMDKLKNKYFLIAGNTSIINRKEMLLAGGYIEELRWHCDWFASYIIALRKGICYLPEGLASLRVLPKSYSTSGTKATESQEKVITDILNILNAKKYVDVAEKFRESKIMSIYGIDLIKVMMKNREYRKYYSIRVLWYSLRQLLKKVVPIRLAHYVKSRGLG
jgi:glycosyltransferase involved in cell wall biosynthesis